MEHLAKKGCVQWFKRVDTGVDKSGPQISMGSGTANRLRKLLHKRKSQQQPSVQTVARCQIPGHFSTSQSVELQTLIGKDAPPAPSTIHINERYIRYDINTTPLVIVLAISIVFFACLLVLKDIILQSLQNIVSVAKWKIIGAPFMGTPYAGLLMGLVGTVLSPLSAVSSWLSFIFWHTLYYVPGALPMENHVSFFFQLFN